MYQDIQSNTILLLKRSENSVFNNKKRLIKTYYY